ncbi:hypothetical protein [Chromobacterium haemolyticum]|uniref:hypothetical protein n=1 Tax=Chromobacterium haemolyticum TaxID=394935 RepID=UPI00244ADDD7|nr:hypothetical protein [Chromobacterium haemolyticum]MDH0340655.1 hypothetical protein [Chromobacterium haemolyticum]
MTELEKQLLDALKDAVAKMGSQLRILKCDEPWIEDQTSQARAAIAAAEATSLQPTVAVVPDFPGRVSIADLDYAQKLKPESWSDEHFETWQLLQVASRNVTRLHIYARQLRSMLEAAPATVKDSLIVQQAPAAPEAIDLLRTMEWLYKPYDDYSHAQAGYYCPECEEMQESGHRDDCKLRALLAAAPAPAQAEQQSPDKWQPIGTAPADGRTILLDYFNSHGNWRTLRGQWVTKERINEEWEDADFFEAGWYETSVEADDAPSFWPTKPTHWQPLPAAPTQEAGARLAAEAKGGSDANH